MAQKTTVSLIRCHDYQPARVAKAVEHQLQLLGGLERFVKPGDSVLLKPNFISPRSHRQDPTQTHPEVILAVARLLKDFGARPFVGDSPGWGDVQTCAEALELIEPLKRLGVPLRQLDRPRTHRVGRHGPRVGLSAVALEADAIINLPKLKAHGQLLVTLAVKNMFGCVSGKRKAMCHYLYGGDPTRFCRLLIDICYFLRPALTLIDGIIAMERTGPSGGASRPLGWLIGGADPLSCETVCCRLLGIDPERVPLLRATSGMQLDGLDLDRIELVGDPPGEPLSDFELPTLAPIRFSLRRVLRSKLRQMWLLARKPKPAPST
ncbi:MAG: DUF362 domain-containing protein [Phycisphaerae bacterium]|nr:DUF362 domain-containing protein [Phycisphaerae bacterium]